MKKLFMFAIMAATLSSCGDSNKSSETTAAEEKPAEDKYAGLMKRAQGFFTALPEVAESAKNPITEEKVALGKMLYFDVRLSKDNTQSCNTCHDLNAFGVDNNALSNGNDGNPGTRNSPTTLNAALHMAQFWDGREPDVEAQAGGPILNPVEMAMPSEKAVVDRLSKIAEYKEMFAKAFPASKPAITYDNLKAAIGAFERKLITPTKFDEYLNGDEAALSDSEKEGLQLYINTGCTTCHTGKLLGGSLFQKFGLFGNYWEYTKSEKIDNGRFDVTGEEFDKYMFKVPSLRNIEKTGPYFHDGSVADLKEAIKIMGVTQLNREISDQEAEKMITFLKTLTGTVKDEYKN